MLAPVVAKAPGQRIPRTVDEAELAVRAVLGQQVSMKAARTHASRLVLAYGDPVDDAGGGLTHTFPSVEQLGDIDPVHLGCSGHSTPDGHRARRRIGRRQRGAQCRLRLECCT